MSHVSPSPGSSICRMKPASTMARYSVLQRLGDGEDVLFLGRVVAVLAAADHGRRDGGHEGLGDRDAAQRRLEGGEVLLAAAPGPCRRSGPGTPWAAWPAASRAADTPCSTRGTRATRAGCRPAAPRRRRRRSAPRSGRSQRWSHEARSSARRCRRESSSCSSRRRRRRRDRPRPADEPPRPPPRRRAPPARPRRSRWPPSRARSRARTLSGRGMLPTCVVRMRSVLVFIGVRVRCRQSKLTISTQLAPLPTGYC